MSYESTFDKPLSHNDGEVHIREFYSSYVTLRIVDGAKDVEAYDTLNDMDEIVFCDAVYGDVDIILSVRTDSKEALDRICDRIRSVEGVEVISVLRVDSPKLDQDVEEKVPEFPGTKIYFIADVDKEAIRQIFTTVLSLDDVISCDVVDGGTKLIGIISESGAFGKTPRIVKKLSRIDGVLRVRNAKIIWKDVIQSMNDNFNYRLWRYDGAPGELIPLLQSAQKHFGYIPRRAIKDISGVTKIAESTIYGVITFYSQFRLQPMGKHQIRLCCGTACHVANAPSLLDTLMDELGVEKNGTTEDGIFTLSTVACIGCCSLAPVMMIDDDTYGNLTPVKVRNIVRKIRREEGRKLQDGDSI